MLHLDARIALDEPVRPGGRLDQKFNGGRVAQTGSARKPHGVLMQSGAKTRFQPGRWRDFNDLLMTQLHRAVALMQMRHIARLIREDLDLDMPRVLDQPLHKERPIAECRLRLALTAREGFSHGGGCIHTADTATPAPGSRLQHHGITNLGRDRRGRRSIFERVFTARHSLHASASGKRARSQLVPKQVHDLRIRTNEDKTRGCAVSGKLRVLSQKPIAWMHRVATLCSRRGDDRGTVQIRANAPIGSVAGRYLTRPSGYPGVQTPGIYRRVDSDRLDTQRCRRMCNSNRYLAAIADQDAFEHLPSRDPPTRCVCSVHQAILNSDPTKPMD